MTRKIAAMDNTGGFEIIAGVFMLSIFAEQLVHYQHTNRFMVIIAIVGLMAAAFLLMRGLGAFLAKRRS
jgi:F0F1-type ATP synthase assembly protein I